jgi:hypothetical protein
MFTTKVNVSSSYFGNSVASVLEYLYKQTNMGIRPMLMHRPPAPCFKKKSCKSRYLLHCIGHGDREESFRLSYIVFLGLPRPRLPELAPLVGTIEGLPCGRPTGFFSAGALAGTLPSLSESDKSMA